MRSTILCGLFIVLICSIPMRPSKASSVESNYDDDDEYNYDDYEYDSISPNPKADDYDVGSTTVQQPTPKADDYDFGSTTVQDEFEGENISLNKENLDYKIESVQQRDLLEEMDNDVVTCPKMCICKEELKFIDCSNQSLSNIPRNLPQNLLHINLSNNNIKQIQENAFSNLTNLREIILKNNQIQNIDRNVFQTVDRLDHIDLSSNNISKLDPDAFLYAQGLSKLDLNNNPIVLQANQSFLNLPNLEILNLVGCNITELFDENFMNLTGLTSLNLANNSFADNVNVKALTPILSLLKLKMPHVSQEATHYLCVKLSVIDVISFDNYNISCYVLISDTSYDESTITHGPLTTVGLETSTTTMRPTLSSTTEKTVVTTTAKQNLTAITHSYRKSNDTDSTTSSTVNALNTTSSETVASTKVEMSSQSVKTILIASIVIAIVGLVIGLICRKDIFGVKTKLCRTQRPEPPTLPEQVPLNKV